jgi:hypothetical protein
MRVSTVHLQAQSQVQRAVSVPNDRYGHVLNLLSCSFLSISRRPAFGLPALGPLRQAVRLMIFEEKIAFPMTKYFQSRTY